MAELDARPSPPGTYDAVVVGSGPGGLQAAYSLRALGVNVAAISQDDAPGGMFRSLPIFGRLLSWSKPDAPAERGSREYEWYDHNSLLANEPEARALVPLEMDRTWAVPSRPEMERGLAAFAERTGLPVRYGCRWESTRREDDGSLTLATTDGEYRCRAAVFALGVTEPWKSDIAGVEDVPHYVDTGEPHDYAGKRVIVIGKRNSGFEIADGLLPWASQVLLISPRPVQTSVLSLASVRVRYMQPLEDYGLGGGTFALDAAIEQIERTASGFQVHAIGTTRPCDLMLEAEAVIAATGFCTPLLDLPSLGVQTVAQGRIPAQTPFWEAAGAPGIYFAGNATQGSGGLRKHGIGASSPAVHGFRYNAQVLAEHLAGSVFGLPVDRPAVDDVAGFLGHELAHGPELWTQKAYLASVVELDGAPRQGGIQPLAHFVDAGGPDALAATIETNAAGEIYPVVYVRRAGRVEEHVLDPDPLHAYDGPAYRTELEGLAAEARK